MCLQAQRQIGILIIIQKFSMLTSYHLYRLRLYESIKASCNGDYVNIDSNNTKCVSEYEALSELIQSLNPYNILEPICVSGSEKVKEFSYQTLKQFSIHYNMLLHSGVELIIMHWVICGK